MHRDGYQVDGICALVGMSRSGCQAHLRKPEGERRRQDDRWRPCVATLFAKNRETCGLARLRHPLLQQDGAALSRERIARLMREAGLTPLQKRIFLPRTTVADPGAALPLTSFLICRRSRAPTRYGAATLLASRQPKAGAIWPPSPYLHSRRIFGWATATICTPSW